ncbi:MAG: SBBP repeat-containing protein, partial [Flavobacteriales bacterium]|nr:SBBP repeat-containing protein [Flavobacteriales bacterium]
MKKRIAIILMMLFPVFLIGQTAEIIAYGGIDHDEFQDIIEYEDGYVVLGFTSSTENNSSDLFLLRYDTDLQEVWQLALGTAGADQAAGLVSDSDGNIYVLGSTSFGENGGYDAYLAKINSDGEQLWERNFGDSEWNFGSAIETDDNQLFIGMRSFSPDLNRFQSEILLVDYDGITSGSVDISGDNDETITDILWYESQLLVSTTEELEETSNARLTSWDLAGVLQWEHIFEGTADSPYLSGHLDADEINDLGWCITLLNTEDTEDT